MLQISRTESIECSLEHVDGFLYPHDEARKTIQALQAELIAAKKAGISNAEQVDLGEFPACPCMLAPAGATHMVVVLWVAVNIIAMQTSQGVWQWSKCAVNIMHSAFLSANQDSKRFIQR